jgi:hypothetical protein
LADARRRRADNYRACGAPAGLRPARSTRTLDISRGLVDIDKCTTLKRELAGLEAPQLVPIEVYFDGNDDLGSIGCNLPDHPGIDAFRQVLDSLQKRPDVKAVYAQITELDPGEDSWPFTDTVVVTGSIPTKELAKALASLAPDEVGPVETDMLSPQLSDVERQSAQVAWWD